MFYPATDAPRFTKGMWAMIGVAIATLGVTWLVWWLERREKRIVAGRREESVGDNSRINEKGDREGEKEREDVKTESEDGH